MTKAQIGLGKPVPHSSVLSIIQHTRKNVWFGSQSVVTYAVDALHYIPTKRRREVRHLYIGWEVTSDRFRIVHKWIEVL